MKIGFGIPKVRRNLISLEQQVLYSRLYAFLLIFDQLVINTLCQSFSTLVGTHAVFTFWWIWNLIMFFFLFIMTPAVWIFWALRDFPEFTNLRGKRYPGQEPPRVQQIIPYRKFTKENMPEVEHRSTRIKRKTALKSECIRPVITVGLNNLMESSNLTEIVVHWCF